MEGAGTVVGTAERVAWLDGAGSYGPGGRAAGQALPVPDGVGLDVAAVMLEMITARRLDVRIGARLPLAQARRAQEYLEARRTTGRLLLLP